MRYRKFDDYMTSNLSVFGKEVTMGSLRALSLNTLTFSLISLLMSVTFKDPIVPTTQEPDSVLQKEYSSKAYI